MARVLNKYKDIISKSAVYIGRPSKWGNPFIIGKDGNREQVVEKYTEWLLINPSVLNDLHELKGRDLICFCSPEKCHGDILIILANQ